MKLAYFIMIFFALTLLLIIQFSAANPAATDQPLPNGYYSFERAPPNSRPPKVRKPPYLSLSTDCQGMNELNTLIPKNNLCGDLNRGFIPRNPMGQYLFGQPYPFELIKNKTLAYLSKTLPFLKEEIESIPKVARFVKPSEFFENHLRRYRRQAEAHTELAAKVGNNGTASSTQPVSATSTTMPANIAPVNTKDLNATRLYRQNTCEGNVVCQALESLKDEGPFSKSFLTNVVSAVGNVASINSVVSLLDQYNRLNSNGTGHNGGHNKFGISQLLSSVSSISDTNGGNSNGFTSGGGGGGQSSSSYSPLLSIIDYIQSLQTPKYAAKRKTSGDFEDYLPDGPEKPQTPCSSTEEYISPTYARNYQGVWKYVVQIPNEGYFTQTIQQTTCLKSKCDLIEGSCRESPRWVSLLVAEIFYPDIYFPVNQIMPMLYKQQLMQAQTQPQPQPTKPTQQPQFQVINSNHNQIKRPLSSMPNSVNNMDLGTLANLLKRHDAYNRYANSEFMGRRARTVTEKPTAEDTDTDKGSNSEEKKHCDGYDKIGCYVVRVYYDWFLVNGSCKCWKSSHSSLNINETIKRIFIGKWKK